MFALGYSIIHSCCSQGLKFDFNLSYNQRKRISMQKEYIVRPGHTFECEIDFVRASM